MDVVLFVDEKYTRRFRRYPLLITHRIRTSPILSYDSHPGHIDICYLCELVCFVAAQIMVFHSAKWSEWGLDLLGIFRTLSSSAFIQIY